MISPSGPDDAELLRVSELIDHEAAVDRQDAAGVDDFYHALLDPLEEPEQRWLLGILARQEAAAREQVNDGGSAAADAEGQRTQ